MRSLDKDEVRMNPEQLQESRHNHVAVEGEIASLRYDLLRRSRDPHDIAIKLCRVAEDNSLEIGAVASLFGARMPSEVFSRERIEQVLGILRG